ncbi:MAG: cyclic nucleotide-binding/CBS domain-containing protein [Candidatus Thorarchaeota archaeon]
MLVRDFMTSMIVTAEFETPVLEAARLMAAEDIGSLMVTRSDVLVGMVTRRDIIAAHLLSEDIYMSLSVEDIMTSPVISISPEADLGQAISVMNQTNAKCLPVMEGDSVIGVVSASDVIRVLATVKLIADGGPDE